MQSWAVKSRSHAFRGGLGCHKGPRHLGVAKLSGVWLQAGSAYLQLGPVLHLRLPDWQ